MPTSSAILESYLASLDSDALDYIDQPVHVTKLRAYNRTYNIGGDFQSSLDYYLNTIIDSDGSFIPHEITIPYLDDEQRAALKWNLQLTKLLLLAQLDYEKQHQKVENTKKYQKYSTRCDSLIDQLNGNQSAVYLEQPDTVDFELAENNALNQFLTKCAHFFRWLLLKWSELFPSTTKFLVSFMTSLNEKRLYWVWGSSYIDLLIKSGLFDCHADAATSVNFPSMATGIISWVLYALRLLVNLFRRGKHFFKHPWMTEEEKEIEDWEKRSKWQEGKYPIKNDAYWGLANFFCWWRLNVLKLGENGFLSLFLAGDIVTFVLLAFDAKMAILDFREQITDYKFEMNGLSLTIAELKQKRIQAGLLAPQQIPMLSQRLYNLEAEARRCKNNWHIKNLNQVNNTAYAIALFAASGVYALGGLSFFLQESGIIFCFVFTIINNFFKKFIEFYEALSAKNAALEDCLRQLNDFLKLGSNVTDNKRIHDYLEINKALAEYNYQSKLTRNHAVKVTISSLAEAIIVPATILFLPTEIGFLLIGLLVVTTKIANHILKPQKEKLQAFDGVAFEEFLKNANTLRDQLSSKNGFFAASKSKLSECLSSFSSHAKAPYSMQLCF